MKRTTSRLASVAAAAVSLAVLAGCATTATGDTPVADEGTYASGDSNVLVFAVLPDREGAAQDAQPVADWIAEITGKEVRFFEATDYTAVVQGLASGQVDIAQISAFTYYQSQAAGAEIEPIGAQITTEGEPAGYFSVAVKNPASSATELADFADQPVCFVNPNSTSGRAIPTAALLDAGVTVAEENTVYGQEHDLTAALVAEGASCQVGFAQDANADPLIEAGDLVEIERFQVPAAPIVMLSALPQEVKDQLVAGLANTTQQDLLDTGIELNSFMQENWFGFDAVDDSYFDAIRSVCEQIADQVEACRA